MKATMNSLAPLSGLLLCSLLVAVPCRAGDMFSKYVADLESDDTLTVEIAADALVAFGERAVPPLLAALKPGNRDRRAAAMVALGKLQAGEAVEPIVAILDELGPVPRKEDTFTDRYLRHVAIRTLGQLGGEKARQALRTVLSSPYYYDRAAAIIGLAALGSDPQLQQLLELAGSPTDDIRNLAIKGLARIHDSRVLPTLVKALDDPRWFVRDNAVLALAELGGPKAEQAVRKALDDPNPFVRRTAEESLSRFE